MSRNMFLLFIQFSKSFRILKTTDNGGPIIFCIFIGNIQPMKCFSVMPLRPSPGGDSLFVKVADVVLISGEQFFKMNYSGSFSNSGNAGDKINLRHLLPHCGVGDAYADG